MIIPGADTLVVVRNTLSGDFRSAVRTTVGVCAGLVAWALMSSIGLATALAASPTLFNLLRAAGAAYLVYLGVQALVAARRTGTPDAARQAGREEAPARSGRDWRQGALTSLGNPKVGVFYTSLLPQFIPADGSSLSSSLLLAAIHVALSFLSLLAYAAIVARMGDVFRKDGWRRVLETVAGAALVAVGLWLMVSAVTGI
ncbi:LysE family translocator [Streptomyces ferrugineus]|uniref:LysE family translocator n=1 Tax=Streptomyces ferrugineus TaxID=1413221 RepID=A0A7M2SMA6_9ACTN|nr:LysE family translocator [Streptomyces ferrugineus]QOV36603.1 LysE family translocator [Streptomyces ferrugineus]